LSMPPVNITIRIVRRNGSEGRRREEKCMKYISVVVPEEIDRELRFACADQATTKSRLVRRLIEQYLEEWREGFEGKGGQIIGLDGEEETNTK
jgi:hypothetical protein